MDPKNAKRKKETDKLAQFNKLLRPQNDEANFDSDYEGDDTNTETIFNHGGCDCIPAVQSLVEEGGDFKSIEQKKKQLEKLKADE